MSNRISLSINNNNFRTERNGVGNSNNNNHVKDIKPRKPRSLKFWFFSFFPFYILTPLLPFLFTQAIWIPVIIVLSGFSMTLFYKGGAWSSKPGTKELSSSVVVLSAIYGIIGGLAITTAIGAYSASIQSLDAEIRTPLDVILLLSHNTKFFSDTVLLLGFFTVALPTYLGSTFFLSHQFDTKEQNKGVKDLFLTFILSFLQSVFLYFMSTSIGSFNQFALWLFLLQIVNSIWSIWQLFSRSSIFKKNYRPPPPREWVPLDVLLVLFLLVYFIYQIEVSWIDYVLLLVVLSVRTLFDFQVGWDSVYAEVIRQK